MFDTSRCFLMAASLLQGMLAVSAYCSCKCDTPEIPYTRVAYAPPVPHVPYKYGPAPHVAVNPYVQHPVQHPVTVQANHRPNYVPIVIIPQVANQQLSHHLPPIVAPAHNSLELQRKEFILPGVGQSSHLHHVQIAPQVAPGLSHPVLVSAGHGDTVTSSQSLLTGQHIAGLQQEQVYQNLQEGVHAQLVGDGAGYDDGHEGHHKKNHHVHYKYGYSVNDHKTGDIKRHEEERHGDDVVGEYSLLEDDGNVRTVKYRADWKTGFHAQVHNSQPRHHG